MKQTVWLLEYQHKHGADFGVYSTYDDAALRRAAIVNEYASGECTAEIALQIHAYINLGHLEDAVSLYCEHVPNESLEIHEVKLELQTLAQFVVVERDNGLAHAVKHLPPGDVGPGMAWCGLEFFWVQTQVSLPVGTAMVRCYLPKEKPVVSCIGCIAQEEHPP